MPCATAKSSASFPFSAAEGQFIQRAKDAIEIIFADNGAGMTPDVQRQSFDPFFTTRRNEGGPALVFISFTITRQLGGRMMLDSRPGQGTTFRIIMPRTAIGAPRGPR